jgi:thioredoxin reductase
LSELKRGRVGTGSDLVRLLPDDTIAHRSASYVACGIATRAGRMALSGGLCTGADLTTWKLDRPPFPLETSLPGVFAAGDVRHNSIKRVSSGVGEGSMAIAFIHQYLSL